MVETIRTNKGIITGDIVDLAKINRIASLHGAVLYKGNCMDDNNNVYMIFEDGTDILLVDLSL